MGLRFVSLCGSEECAQLRLVESALGANTAAEVETKGIDRGDRLRHVASVEPAGEEDGDVEGRSNATAQTPVVRAPVVSRALSLELSAR